MEQANNVQNDTQTNTDFSNKRLALIGIIIEDTKNESDKENIKTVNRLLSEYSDYIVGRMGLPYKEREVNVISIVIDAPADKISALSGKLGKLSGITSKVVYSKI